MGDFAGFIGESYTARALAFDAQRSMNLYLEADESGSSGMGSAALLGTPGLTLAATLTHSPVRGIWTGLIEDLPGSTGSDLCYLVAGSKFYQITFDGSTWTGTVIGDVGSDGLPVTFQVNGGQIFITSAGLGWIYDGTTLGRAFFSNGQGTCDTAGTALTWDSGDAFDSTLIGSGIVVNGTVNLITAVADGTHLTLQNSAGAQSGVAFRVMAGAGVVNINNLIVTWVSGDDFTGIGVGDKIIIGATIFTVGPTPAPTAKTLHVTSPDLGVAFGVAYQADRAVPAAISSFLDTYFIAVPPNSKVFYISAPNNGKSWSPLDFGRKEAYPDNISSILADHEELWIYGTETSEVWQDTGNADFPFQRIPSAFIRHGCVAPFTAVSIGEGVAWIAADERGGPIAYFAQGFAPQRISTHAIEAAWGEYSDVSDATAYMYVQDGHQFWVISFPTGNSTWVWDATAGKWHERGSLYTGVLGRQFASTHGFVFGRHLVGDWRAGNGKLYVMSPDVYTEDGTAILRIRTAPYLTNEELWTFYSRFRLAMQSGANPTLAWSDDLGLTYSMALAGSPLTLTPGVTQMNQWMRMGRARARIYSVQCSDAVQIAFTGAYIDAKNGNG